MWRVGGNAWLLFSFGWWWFANVAKICQSTSFYHVTVFVAVEYGTISFLLDGCVEAGAETLHPCIWQRQLCDALLWQLFQNPAVCSKDGVHFGHLSLFSAVFSVMKRCPAHVAAEYLVGPAGYQSAALPAMFLSHDFDFAAKLIVSTTAGGWHPSKYAVISSFCDYFQPF